MTGTAEGFRSTAELLERLGSTDRTQQRLACGALAERFDSEPELRDALIARLRNSSPQGRFAAAFVLFQVERPTLRLLPALLAALELDDGDVRWQATHMLAVLGRLHGEVMPVMLSEAASADSAQRRRMAIYVLRELAPERPETAQACTEALDDADGEVRRAALTCFAKLGESDARALSRVLEILREGRDARERRIAAIVLPRLVELHPEARSEVCAALEPLRGSEDASLARAAEAAASRLADVD